MTSFRAVIALPLALSLAACLTAEQPKTIPAFVGSWDCGEKRLTLTTDNYGDDTGTYPLRLITRNDRDFTLFLTNGQKIALVAVTQTGLTLVTGASGNQLNCLRADALSSGGTTG